ncbi:MAG TPA: metal-dependent transcriptional regulator [Capillimicrobium sp.]|nr:metal-dependent transcriptional regulator [Capillimicrobium sp.]
MTQASVETELRPPSPAEARYLEVMGRLGRGGRPVAGAAIARALGLSAPTVHEMLRRLAADGFIVRGESTGWVLTDTGRRQADAVRRRRRVVEHFLRAVLKFPEEEVAGEADALLTAVSPQLEERLRAAAWPGERPCSEAPIHRERDRFEAVGHATR